MLWNIAVVCQGFVSFIASVRVSLKKKKKKSVNVTTHMLPPRTKLVTKQITVKI